MLWAPPRQSGRSLRLTLALPRVCLQGTMVTESASTTVTATATVAESVSVSVLKVTKIMKTLMVRARMADIPTTARVTMGMVQIWGWGCRDERMALEKSNHSEETMFLLSLLPLLPLLPQPPPLPPTLIHPTWRRWDMEADDGVNVNGGVKGRGGWEARMVLVAVAAAVVGRVEETTGTDSRVLVMTRLPTLVPPPH